MDFSGLEVKHISLALDAVVQAHSVYINKRELKAVAVIVYPEAQSHR